MRSASRADFARLSLTSLAFSESYLIGRVHCSAKRTPKTHYFLRQPKLDALRWHLSAAPFFDSHRFQKCSGNGRPFEPAQQSLQCGRVVAGDSLSHHPRPRTHRDHAVAATQWGLSISERIVDLSQSQHPQTIPAAHGTPSPAQVAQASRSVPGKMVSKPHPPWRLIFDVDSTVLVVYGKQEEGKVGYNPIKHGRPSYHPLLCFEGQTKDFWHGELRPGDVPTSSGVLELLGACFAKIPVGVRAVLVRADKGFYD